MFHDRLINREDKTYFNTILAEMAQKHFSEVGLLQGEERRGEGGGRREASERDCPKYRTTLLFVCG